MIESMLCDWYMVDVQILRNRWRAAVKDLAQQNNGTVEQPDSKHYCFAWNEDCATFFRIEIEYYCFRLWYS